ncbi:MAG: UDP-N-acetylmuramoyl-L-alanyl-D-glutamate--2,6-diaminopimelate ligase [Thermoanaerobaculia bacterium]
MRLSELVAEVPHRLAGPKRDPEVRAVTHDSRRAAAGTLFAAFPGANADGRTFLNEAIGRGAVAALGPAPAPPSLAVPYVEVGDPRGTAGVVAAKLAGDPSSRLVMVGVTGTSGKTTTTLLVDRMLQLRHERRGLFGTLVYRGGGDAVEASRTTPEATELQPMLASLVEEGGTAAVMECSSHALALGRLSGCAFDVAAFLNLSRDHLDFHRDLEDYFQMKARLMGMLKPGGKAVLNADDPYGLRLFQMLPFGRAITFALGHDTSADVKGTAQTESDRTVLHVMDFVREHDLEIVSPLLGLPNAENLLAAAAIGGVLGLSPEEIAEGLSAVDCVPGRMERVPNAFGFTLLVDYAHKPGALEGVLKTARALAEPAAGRVLVVFGCGGDRDRGKRPEMGRIAVTLADDVIITSDNPRSEEPEAILLDIHAGVAEMGRPATFLVDRREAIAEAIRRARRGDVLVIAGKGHEKTQETAGVKQPFDDRLVALELLAARESTNG